MKDPGNILPPPSFLDALRERLGEETVCCDGEVLSHHVLGRLRPQAVISPQTLPQLSSLLQMASQQGLPVLLWGAGKFMGLGNPPRSMELAVNMTGMKRLLSHDVGNFTATAEAGMRLGDLQRILEQQGQFLPLDPPAAEEATLGGIVATNACGPWRLSFGSARDLVLGMKVVLGDGRIVSFGGKTVKNVAGYDVCKLLVGSLGTLGAICEITFRLYSLPDQARTLLLAAGGCEEAFALARRGLSWLAAAAQIFEGAAAKLLSEVADRPLAEGNWLVAIDLMGDAAVVEKQSREIAEACAFRTVSLSGEERRLIWEAGRRLTRTQSNDAIICRVSLPPAALEGWMGQWEQRGWSAASRVGHVIVCPGTGRAWAQFWAEDEQTAAELVEAMRAEAQRMGGHLFVENAPEEWKERVQVWGAPPPHISLLRAIKKAFDPSGILSPGRFVGGI